MFDYFKGDGRDYWSSERVITHSAIHWHKFFEVELILDGEGIELINGVSHKIEKGYLTVIPPGSFHSYDVLGDNLQIVTVCFAGMFLSSEIREKLSVDGDPWLFKLDDGQFARMRDWFRMLDVAINEKCVNRDDIVKRMIELILLFCPRPSENLVQAASDGDIRQLAMVRTVLNYIDEHYAERISRDDLAESLHYSPCYFSAVFHKLSGVTLSEYITGVRMSKAVELINRSETPISEIIQRVGYRSEPLFYKTFRKYFGANPNELRRRKVASLKQR